MYLASYEQNTNGSCVATYKVSYVYVLANMVENALVFSNVATSYLLQPYYALANYIGEWFEIVGR